MDRDELLGIGAFAVLSGLSINALRHYNEIGVLRPAQVAPDTGYRRYHPDQARQARMIWALRYVDLPIESVRQAVGAAADGDALRAILRRHREALADRAGALSGMIAAVDPHHGPTGTTRFALLVADLDATHRRALDAGATERHPPYEAPWKPRSSHIIDPSGNWIDLTQA
ncbi:MAG TPA: MerR family transcriptional regulator [Actinocrinis sp.]